MYSVRPTRSFLLNCLIFCFLLIWQVNTVRAVVRDGQIDPSINISPISIGGNGRIYCFAALPDGKILVGGAISNISAGSASNIGRLNADGSYDPTFHGAANNTVKAIFPLSDGKILISGDFLQYGGIARNRIARINPDGSLDQTFSPNFGTDYVQIVAVQPDEEIIVNGTFLSIGGIPRSRVARLNPDGSVDVGFTVGSGTDNAGVDKAVVQSDGKILFAGRFTSYDGQQRPGVLRLNTDGSLDSTFVPNLPGDQREFPDIGLTNDGKVFIGGYNSGDDVVYRLNPDGTRDMTFLTPYPLPGSGLIRSILAQPDGKVIVGADSDTIFRLNSNGSIDSSFAPQITGGGIWALSFWNNDKVLVGGDFGRITQTLHGGIGRIDLAGNRDSSFLAFLGSLTNINVFYLYPDGKMLVGGSFDAIGTTFSRYLARLNPDGSVDNSFQVDSRVDHIIYAIAVQPDGKIVLGGYTGDSGFGGTLGKGVWRINPDGSLDTSLDTQIEHLEAVSTIAIQTDGKILIGGGFSTVNGVARRALARLNSNGSLDTSFTPAVGGLALSKVALQPDGKILIGGGFSTINGSPIANFARLNPDGTVDSGFNIGPGANNSISSFLVLPDGRIYVGGSFSSITGVSRGSLVRLKSDGNLDSTFKPVKVSSNVGSIIQLPNNKILIGGSTNSTIDAAPRRKIIRLLEDGSVDFSFDVSGATFNGSQGTVYQLAIQFDGRILAAGQFDGLNGAARSGFARLLTFSNLTPPFIDFDGDGKTDISVFRPSTGIWYRLNSYLNQFRAIQWGTASDLIVHADFDGDFSTDTAVFRPSTGFWYWINSSDETVSIVQFGVNGDMPFPADYDGDGKADLAQFRPSDGNWYVFRSSDNGVSVTNWGNSTDIPVPGDYDGDGKTDVAVYRPTTGQWFAFRSTAGPLVAGWGAPGDKPVPADYDGDGMTDLAQYRLSEGNWYIFRSSDNGIDIVQWGSSTDTPIPGDYDGDGTYDKAVYRNGTWFVLRSTDGPLIANWGVAGDVPIPAAYIP